MASEIDARLKEVACNLAAADRYVVDQPVEIGDGFQVPRWLTYVSEARKLIIQHNVITWKVG